MKGTDNKKKELHVRLDYLNLKLRCIQNFDDPVIKPLLHSEF